MEWVVVIVGAVVVAPLLLWFLAWFGDHAPGDDY